MIEIESFGVMPVQFQEGTWKIFLILHKQGNHWSFPKGRADPGESPRQSAMRELKEETGLDVIRFIQEEPLIEHYTFRRKTEWISKRVYYYAAEVGGEVQLQADEIREGKWITFPEALQALTFKEGKALCHQLMKTLHISV